MINYWKLLLAPFNAVKYFSEQKWFYKEAKLSNEEFLKKYPELEDLVLSCSWSNDQYLGQIGRESKEIDEKKIFEGIKFLVEKIQLNNIRIRLIWSELEDESGKLNIPEIDRKIIEYLFDKKIEICLNIGPIKCFRYPEMHLPQRVFDLAETPKEKEYHFNLENPIAKESLIYLEKLCILIRKTFDQKIFDKYVTTIQLDNEPKSRFGLHKWLLSDEYMGKTFLIAEKFFPTQKFLINSPFIPYDWTEILEPDLQLCLNLIKKLPINIQNKIIIGINFYNYVPNIPKIPFFNIHPDNYSAFEAMFGDLRKTLEDMPFEFEVSESQFEPWGDSEPFNLPGTSNEHLKYSLLRHSFKLPGKTKTIRLWGMEILLSSIYKD